MTDTEGKDKHDEADWQPDDLGMFTPTTCTTCTTRIYTTPGKPGQCLACARTHAGITWDSGQNIGQWHPTVGYPRPLPKAEKPGNTQAKWRWACTRCLMTGPADNAANAVALDTMHAAFACPLTPGLSADETKLRTQRRQALTQLYPDQVPPLRRPTKKGPESQTETLGT